MKPGCSTSCPACPNSIPNPEHVRNSLSWQDATLAKLRLNVTETRRDRVNFVFVTVPDDEATRPGA